MRVVGGDDYFQRVSKPMSFFLFFERGGGGGDKPCYREEAVEIFIGLTVKGKKTICFATP